ncbi:hypothetical protein FA13DRAFT_1654916, partial [Coprinellus micaceus]
FHALSDISGLGGMQKEIIQATPSWQKGPPCHDCVYIKSDTTKMGFEGLTVAQVHFFLPFMHDDKEYQCAYVRWFETYGESPCPVTGM